MGKSNKIRIKLRKKKIAFPEGIQHALFAQERARHLSEDVQAHNGRAAFAKERLREMVPRGLYEHWKSTAREPKFYIAGVVWCEMEGEVEPVVPVTSLYLPHAGEQDTRVLLGRAGFLVPVRKKKPGGRFYAGPRFKLIRPLNWIQAGLIEQAAHSLAKSGYSRRQLLKAIEDCTRGILFPR